MSNQSQVILENDPDIGRGIKRLNLEIVPLMGLLIVLLIVFTVLSPYFLNVKNFMNIGRQIAIDAIPAAASTILLISGGFDLSIGSVMAVSGMVAGLLLGANFPISMAVLGAIVFSSFAGLSNGLLVSKVGINPFIVTLGMEGLIRGVGYLVSGNQAIIISDVSFLQLGQGYALSLPTPLILVVIVFVVSWFLLNYTKHGRYAYAIGGNVNASKLVGIRVPAFTTFYYILSSISAGISGILLASIDGSAIPTAAQDSALNVLSAVILGGTSLSGGRGSIGRTVIGILIIGILTNGLQLLGVTASWQLISQAFVLLLVVSIDQLRLRRAQ